MTISNFKIAIGSFRNALGTFAATSIVPFR
jgi:hypothetical protein